MGASSVTYSPAAKPSREMFRLCTRVRGMPMKLVPHNGLTQGAYYGDDAQMATNYPLARLRDPATGKVTYCRTRDYSTMGVATGAAIVDTTFTVPASLPIGQYQLAVVANGIASDEVAVTVDTGSGRAQYAVARYDNGTASGTVTASGWPTRSDRAN